MYHYEWSDSMISNRISLQLAIKKAWFPATITIISLLLFIRIYMLLTASSIGTNNFIVLIFALLVISFGCITFFCASERLSTIGLFILTGILTIVLSSIVALIYSALAFEESIKPITDIDQYERVLEMYDDPNKSLIEHFPDKIPQSAEDVVLRFYPGFLQGGT